MRLRNGIRLRCRIEEFEGYVAVFLEATYDVPGIRWESLQSIVDVGANVGVAMLWFAGRAPQARLAVVEPSPAVWDLLTENVHANGLTARVQLIHAAVGGASGSAHLEPGRYSIETRLALETNDGPVTQVMTLGELLDRARMSEVDLLKLDCEGAEYDLLLSAEEPLLRRVGVIVGEYHPMLGHSREELARCLVSAGFSVSLHGADQGRFVAARGRALAI